MKRAWKKADGESDEPPSGGTTPHVASLRERLENSNYILLRIPIAIHLFPHGQWRICMDPGPLPGLRGLSDEDIDRLEQAVLVRLSPPTQQPKNRIDYETIQQTYALILADGGFTSEADLARHLGISRVRMGRGLKGIKRNAD